MSNDPSGQAEDAAEGGQLRASTLELFFDLVFVFTITQLTHVFSEHPGWVELGRVALMFGVIWWIGNRLIRHLRFRGENVSVARRSIDLGYPGVSRIFPHVPAILGRSRH
ncbi:low temperature requirement protein A [Nocardia sp. alder85J]|uniref:low temperature requirement protein A n=1 Tax=Nocardia sp. alder85J TaxID=2862949 RepID=UPI001CD7269A|nr:low temperature requirement protein A [Nocardia sp. alder85J]MCX4094464.1 low temperature requirement protein A [Nocardia sp. alder85J]